MSVIATARPVSVEFGAKTQSFREVSADFSGVIGSIRTEGVTGKSQIRATLTNIDCAPTSHQMWDCELTLEPTSRGIPGMASFPPGDAIKTSARIILQPLSENTVVIQGISENALHRVKGDEMVTGKLTIRPIARLDENLTVAALLSDSNVANAVCGMKIKGV